MSCGAKIFNILCSLCLWACLQGGRITTSARVTLALAHSHIFLRDVFTRWIELPMCQGTNPSCLVNASPEITCLPGTTFYSFPDSLKVEKSGQNGGTSTTWLLIPPFSSSFTHKKTLYRPILQFSTIFLRFVV